MRWSLRFFPPLTFLNLLWNDRKVIWMFLFVLQLLSVWGKLRLNRSCLLGSSVWWAHYLMRGRRILVLPLKKNWCSLSSSRDVIIHKNIYIYIEMYRDWKWNDNKSLTFERSFSICRVLSCTSNEMSFIATLWTDVVGSVTPLYSWKDSGPNRLSHILRTFLIPNSFPAVLCLMCLPLLLSLLSWGPTRL